VLPEPPDAQDEQVIADIREYGWHVVIVLRRRPRPRDAGPVV
jgi:hypothetical protein